MRGGQEECPLVDKETKWPGTEMVLKEPAGLLLRGDVSREIEFQSLWFTLARIPWRSLVVVPGDENGSSAAVATALADVGRRLRNGPVTFLVMGGSIDYASAGRIVASVAGPPGEVRGATGSSGRVIVAIPSVVTEPLGVAVTDAADAVVLCVEKGRTRTPSALRTIEMIGRDRIIGCVLV
jgi:hypothetical protein